ncbi:hypothetical protein PL2TA16_01784 [Pseudoalteromonas luteoviolacea 2ta16]|uniref:Uncharacterized protein n=1 Tax=Pseudoalteromonas luteoviolacea (strain 2ta16) TaxID=1353533 RepID=V4HIP5_PSEL2|nr:hypothetical protein PL2TA16_01784 [Pseudoalteromonas luteoviolacea 2ta16]
MPEWQRKTLQIITKKQDYQIIKRVKSAPYWNVNQRIKA